MKAIIATDPHYGSHNCDKYFFEKALDITIKLKNRIIDERPDALIIAGDFWDNKEIINKMIAFRILSLYAEMAKLTKIYIIVGNHDCFYKQTNEINTLSVLLKDADNIEIVDMKPIKIDNVCLIPWINETNKKEIYEFISENNNKENVLIGHFEKAGFSYNMHRVSEHDSFPTKIATKYKQIISGHYHLKQRNKRWFFIGSLMELKKDEAFSEHGYLIYDTISGEEEFVLNENNVYENINLTEEEALDENILLEKLKIVKNKMVEVYLNSSNEKLYEKVSNVIRNFEPKKYILKYNQILEVAKCQTEQNADELKKILKSSSMIDNYFNEILKNKSEKEKKLITGMFHKYREKALNS
jgi:DNA repair exonuclease SbcCD nuclease subunit